ncbi:MAG: B12-binding domain-containing radical SAM protein [Solirubrobacterales bacterium]
MKEKRILLIEPPFFRLYHPDASLNKLPLSLGYLAGSIRDRRPDWQVKIYNADFSARDMPLDYGYLAGPGYDRFLHTLNDPGASVWKEVEDTIVACRPSVVGITSKSQNYLSVCMIARIAKRIDRSILVVVGGPHPSLAGADALKESAIDVVARGEGEETILEILDSAEGKLPLSSVQGIVYRDGGEIRENPPGELIQDLDALAFPVRAARECLIDYDKYPIEAFKYLFGVRGCPYACTFCGSRYIWGRNVRFRSAKNIAAEMRELQQLGIDYVHFDDDTFGVKKPFIRELCGQIKDRCPGLSWSCEIHARLVDDEIVAMMKSAGCRSILLGVESGNDEMLRRIRKNITIEDAFSAAKIIKRHGIYLYAFFIVGFPHETQESLNDTITAIQRLPADVVVYSIFTPYFGTELFDWCKEHGIIAPDFNPFLHNHQSPDNYFCPQIPEDVFKSRVRQLEKMLDRINSRRKLRMCFSREGLRRLREKGGRRALSRVLHLCRHVMHLK